MKSARLAAAVFFLGCAAPTPGSEPRVRFGRDACAVCGMIISEAGFAAGYVDGGGKTVAFDDVGEALDALAKTPDLTDRLFVGDLEKPGWFLGAEAFYVRVKGLPTPMGSGVAAFSDRERAEIFARDRRGEGPKDLGEALLDFGENHELARGLDHAGL